MTRSDPEGPAIQAGKISLVNLPNTGQMPWLPEGVIVEGNVLVRANEMVPTVPLAPPAPVQSLICRVVETQSMTLEGLLNQDCDLLYQALLCDPLVTGRRPDEVLRMWNAMREAAAPHLPDWARLS